MKTTGFRRLPRPQSQSRTRSISRATHPPSPLSPPLRTSVDSDLQFWAHDGRAITSLVPEFDDYLRPDEARVRFAAVKQMKIIAVEGAKHLWIGEPSVHRVLSEITAIIAPDKAPLPLEY